MFIIYTKLSNSFCFFFNSCNVFSDSFHVE